MALIDKASLLFVPSVVAEGKAFNILPSGNRAPDSTDQNSGYDQTRADFDFDRGSNAAATRIGSDGLIKKYRENRVLYSNDFSQSNWSKLTNTTYTLTTETIVDPFGVSKSIYKVTLTGSGYITLRQSFIGDTRYMTASVYIKLGSSDYNVTLDQSDGDSQTAEANTDWQRLSSTHASGYSFSFIDIALTGDSGDYFYVSSAQIELGGVATDYLDSTSVTAKAGILVDLPRINYDANGQNGALLLEPSRANLFETSEYFETSDWSKDNITLTTNDSESPEGLNNASLIFPNSTSSGATYIYNTTTGSSSKYTISAYVKADGLNVCWLYISSSSAFGIIYYDLSDKSIQVVAGSASTPTGKITDMGNGWHRIVFTMGSAASIASGSGLGICDAKGGFSVTKNGEDGVLVYGAQLEAGSYSSSYIPTMGTSETRAADSCSVTGASDVIGQTEGTFYLDVQTPDAIQNNTTFSIGGGTSSEYAQIEIRTDLSINWRYRVGGTDYINANVGSYSAGDRLKIAFGYKNGDSILYLNGSSTATDTGSIVSNSWDEVKYSNFADTGKLEASVYETILFNERLSNAELATLTTL